MIVDENLLLITAIKPRPLIAIGSGWQSVFDQFYSSQDIFISPSQRDWLHFAPDVATAFRQLQEMLTSGKV